MEGRVPRSRPASQPRRGLRPTQRPSRCAPPARKLLRCPETHGVLLPAAASLEEIRMNPGFVPCYYFSSHFKSYSLWSANYHLDIRKCLGKSKLSVLETEAVSPSLNLSREVDYASIFFFFFFHFRRESRLQRDAFSIAQYLVFLLLPFPLPLPSSLPTSQIRSLPVQPD